MYETYKDRVKFVLVYVREAHPIGDRQAPPNVAEGILLETAKTFEEKESHATMCVRKLDIHFTTVINNMDNKVESDYTALPDRLYLVDKNGRIAFKSKPGPHGFFPEELEAAIRKELGG